MMLFLTIQFDFIVTGALAQTASLTPNKTAGSAPLLVSFDIQVGPGSSGNCQSASWILAFGDGEFAQGFSSTNLDHVYHNPGSLEATLVYTRFQPKSPNDPTCEQQQVASYSSIQVEDPSLVRFIGGNGNWFDPTNWSTGRVPNAEDDVVVDGQIVTAQDYDTDAQGNIIIAIDPAQNSCDTCGAANKVEFQSLQIMGRVALLTYPGTEIEFNDLILTDGAILRTQSTVMQGQLLKSVISEDSERGAGTYIGGFYNPSQLNSAVIEIDNVGLALALGGTRAAGHDGAGTGYYANVQGGEVSFNNTPLEISTIYEFNPEVGDQFVIVEASGSLTGGFVNYEDGDLVLTRDDVGLFISYEGNQIILRAELLQD